MATQSRPPGSADRAETLHVSITEEDVSFTQEWDELADRAATSPFLRPGFLFAWQRAFGEGPLHLAAVRRRGRLVAALPFNERHREKAYPANWHTPLAGVLCEDADSASSLVEVVAGRRTRRLSMAFVDEQDEPTREFAGLLQAAGFRLIERPLAHSPYIALSGDWQAFQAEMSSKALRDIRRRWRRLQERGTVTIDNDAREPASVDASFREVLAVESSGWKDDRGTALSRDDSVAGFYRDVSRWAAERGWLRLTFLRLDGAPLAVSVALAADGVHYGLKLGYDPAFRQYMPGVLLMHEIVRDAFAKNMRRVEMLGDDEAYKRIWCSSTRQRLGFQAFGPSLAGRVDHFAFSSLRPLAIGLGAQQLARRILAPRDGPRL